MSRKTQRWKGSQVGAIATFFQLTKNHWIVSKNWIFAAKSIKAAVVAKSETFNNFFLAATTFGGGAQWSLSEKNAQELNIFHF